MCNFSCFFLVCSLMPFIPPPFAPSSFLASVLFACSVFFSHTSSLRKHSTLISRARSQQQQQTMATMMTTTIRTNTITAASVPHLTSLLLPPFLVPLLSFTHPLASPVISHLPPASLLPHLGSSLCPIHRHYSPPHVHSHKLQQLPKTTVAPTLTTATPTIITTRAIATTTTATESARQIKIFYL